MIPPSRDPILRAAMLSGHSLALRESTVLILGQLPLKEPKATVASIMLAGRLVMLSRDRYFQQKVLVTV